MELTRLPFGASLAEYRVQAETLLDGWRAHDPGAIRIFRHSHPRFLTPDIPWLPRNIPDDEIQNASLDVADAQLAVARWYDFGNWERLAEYAGAVANAASPVARFESAVEAVTSGDPDRYNPKGNHGHSTPLHQAALAGHDDVVRLLVTRGARLDIRDTIYQATPLGRAVYGGRTEIADYLRARGTS